MSWDCDLCDPVTGEVIIFDFKHDMRGGTFALGGTNQATLNVTYNYGKHFYFRLLHGKTGAESILIFEREIKKLNEDVDPDYWKPTQGNVKQAIFGLRALAQLRPDGIWNIQ